MSVNNSVKCGALLFAVSFFSVPVMAESSWFWQHPYPTGSHINGIQFIDSSNGWIVTQYGALFGTDDGGSAWEELYRGDEILERVFFLNTSEGWACGEDGVVLHTTDGGETWTSSNPNSNHFLSIEFIDEIYGTIVGHGGTIMRTMNGGSSWQLQGSGISYPIFDVSFVDISYGWVTGSPGKIIHTETAGAFWFEQITGIPVVYSGIHFIDETNGFAVGEDYIAETDVGGDSWSAAFYENGADFSDVDFSGNLGAAPGTGGVAVTEDGGGQWQYESMPPSPPGSSTPYLRSVSVPSNSMVRTAGHLGLIYSRNLLGNWSQLSSHETLQDLNGITHFDENHVWGCGYHGTIMRSSDGGESWENQVIDDNYCLRDICFPTVLVGYCVGYSSEDGVILKTVDGGLSWTEITPITPDLEMLYSVDFMNEDRGVAVGSSGEIVYTTDGGVSWTEKTGLGSTGLSRVRFGDTDRGWIVGNSGKIICFDFNSDSWSEQTSAMTQSFNGLFALNADTVWAVGWSGTVVRTLDAGLSWNTVAVTGKDYQDVWFASNGRDGYFTGVNFGQTSNGGFTIVHSPTGSLENLLYRLSFADVNNGWGCAFSGMILRFGEGSTGIEDFNHSIPSMPRTSILSSPNPFTSSSTVSFTTPAECNVTLYLYDLSGRMVQTLQAGTLPGGEHSLMIDGTDLAAGMYFLRLTAEGAVETRSVVRIP